MTLKDEERSARILTKMIMVALKEACDTVAPRRKPPPVKRKCEKRKKVEKKRHSARASAEELSELESKYREAKKELRKAIKKAKTESWKELMATIEKDPWGLPYKVVLRKLKGATPGLTEQLEESQNELLQSLFPRRRNREERLVNDQDEEETPENAREKKVTSAEWLKDLEQKIPRIRWDHNCSDEMYPERDL